MKSNSRRAKPITVAVGNVKVSIYTVTKATGYPEFQVADYSTGKRRLRSFADLPTAKREAERIARLLASGQTAAAQMDGTATAAYGLAVERLRPTGDALDVAASRYAEAVAALNWRGNLLVAAAEFYMKRSPENLTPKPIEEAIAELLESKKSAGKSDDYLDDLKIRLGKLAAAFPNMHVAAITSADVQRWLDAMKAAPQTKANCRRVAGTLFSFCEVRSYIPRTTNPATMTERITTKNGNNVEIYSPQEIAALLSAAPAEIIPALAIAAFTGCRSAELMRLEWKDVDTVGGFVTVSAEKSKTASRRLVPISPNLAQWLAPHRRDAGRIWHLEEWSFTKAMRKVAAQAGVELKANGMRHSYASYRLAEVQSAAQVSLEMGNSPQMLNKHYRELSRPTDAAAWFAVAPQQPANIVPITKAA